MSEFSKRSWVEAPAVKNRRENIQRQAALINVRAVRENDDVKSGSVAVYCYANWYIPDAIMHQLMICGKFAHTIPSSEIVYFSDWHRSTPELRRLIALGKMGLLKAVVFRNLEVFCFCEPPAMSRHLAELRDAGVEIHFAEDSRLDVFMNIPAKADEPIALLETAEVPRGIFG